MAFHRRRGRLGQGLSPDTPLRALLRGTPRDTLPAWAAGFGLTKPNARGGPLARVALAASLSLGAATLLATAILDLSVSTSLAGILGAGAFGLATERLDHRR
ncbi:MAG: hypothetical protein ACFBRM_09080 [Pikeienuella sp.]